MCDELPDDETRSQDQQIHGSAPADGPPLVASEDKFASSGPPSGSEQVCFENVSLFEVMLRLLRKPRQTFRELNRIFSATEPIRQASVEHAAPSVGEQSRSGAGFAATVGRRDSLRSVFTANRLQLLVYAVAVICALIGTNAMLGAEGVRRIPANTLDVGTPFLLAAFFIWLIAELIGHHVELWAWWMGSDTLTRMRWIARIIPLAIWLLSLQAIYESMSAETELSLSLLLFGLARFVGGVISWFLIDFIAWRIRARRSNTDEAEQISSDAKRLIAESQLPVVNPESWRGFTRRRLALVLLLLLTSLLLWQNTSGNRIAPPYIVLWIANSFGWAFVFSPYTWNLLDWISDRIDVWRRIKWGEYRWVLSIFALIMIFGISFRLSNLDTVPREMTSDHVEKIQDGYRVFTGEYKIFFPNNGGREPLQMYLLSMLASLPGLGFNFYTLKLLAVLESIATLPLLLWMGIELIGEKRDKYHVVVALLLSALVAVSYWHVIISRQGLRIPWTPIVTALLLIYLARAMRHNRRIDFVKAGLVLGFGLYMYQAVRILPVLIVAGVAVAIVVRKISWRERLRYLIHLGILVFVSLMVFLPLLHYSLENPNHFWMRTTTRILGDNLAFASPEESEDALSANFSVLMSNVRNALLMFNWKGDMGWFNGAPQYPVMDVYTGAFLVLGAAAWLVRMIKSRDPVIWFMPLLILIMLLPTTLSLAHPEANPSNSRALGAVPAVYLVAAVAIATLAFQIMRCFSRRKAMLLALVFCFAIVLLAHQRNTATYFQRYADAYAGPSFPHSEAGRIVRGFAESDGAIGNVFSIGFAFWWDYRALGIEAGFPLWPNDGWPMEQLPLKLKNAVHRRDEFRLVPDKDLLFLLNIQDAQAREQLRDWFPDGRELLVQSYHPEDRFLLYRVPSLGESRWDEFFAQDHRASG